MKPQTTELVKFLELQSLLGTTKHATAGLLELLWHATAKNAPEGDIGRFTDRQIAVICDWPGDPAKFIDALVDTAWLDRCENHRLLVHDWPDHAPNYVKGFLKKHGRKFASNGSLPGSVLGSVPGTLLPPPEQPARHGATKPNQTKPIQSKENTCPESPPDGEQSGPNRVRKRKPHSTKDPLFDRFWNIYPRREGKAKALQRFTEAVKRIAEEKSISRAEAAELLIERAGAFAESPKGQSGQFCPMAQRWLYEGRWDDDPATWEIDPKESQLTPAQRRKRSISKVMEDFLAKEDSDDPQ